MEDQRQPPLDHPDLRLPLPEIMRFDKWRRDEYPVDLVLLEYSWYFSEVLAVLRHMKPLPGQTTVLVVKEDEYYSYVGVFGVYRVALVFEVSTIKDWSPKAVIVIETTNGLVRNQQQVGDVIISHDVETYSLSSGDVMTPSKSIEASSMFLWNQFAELETKDWKFGSAKVHRGQLVSGNIGILQN